MHGHAARRRRCRFRCVTSLQACTGRRAGDRSGLHLISWAATGVNASAWDDSFTASDPARVYPLSLREVKALLGMETHTYDDVLDQLIADVCEAGRTTPGTCSAAAPSP